MIESAVRDRSDALVRTLLDSDPHRLGEPHRRRHRGPGRVPEERLEGWGFTVEVHPTTSHPIIYAEIGPKDAKFTWLLYGHYDVYPADEKQEGWRTKPFEPVVEGDRIWGRGHRRQQGPAPRDAERDRAVARDARRAAGAHQGDPRGRRGDGSIPLPKFVEANRAR
jgi:hypothetical protein